MLFQRVEAPLFPLMPRPLQDRLAPGLLHALWRWAARGAMHRDEDATVSRQAGGRV